MQYRNKILFTIYSIVTLFCLFYGLPLTIININKEYFYIYLVVAVVGVILLVIGALYIKYKDRKNNNKDE